MANGENIVQGISSGNPEEVTNAVRGALFNEEFSENDNNETLVIKYLTNIDTVISTTNTKISDGVSSINDTLSTILETLKSGEINANLNISGSDLSFLDTIKNLSFSSFAKSNSEGVANKIVNTIKILADGEKYIKGAKKVVDILVSINESMKDVGKSLISSAAGIAIFGLAIFGVGLLFASNPAAVLSFAIGLTVVGGALFLFNLLVDEKEIIKTGIGIAIMGLAIWGVTELFTTTPSKILDFAFGLTIVGGALFLLDKLVNPTSIIKTALGVAAIGGSLVVLGYGIEQFSNIGLGSLGVVGLAITGTALAFSLAGSFAAQIGLGALAIGASGIAIFALAKGVEAIGEIEGLSLEKLGLFGLATAGLVGAMLLIGNPVTLPFLLVGAAQTALIAGSTLLLSGAILAVSKLPKIEISKFDNLRYAANVLTETFSSIGGPITLAKVVAGAGIVGLMSAATIGIGTGLRIFTSIASKPEDTINATTSLRTFVDGTVATFEQFSGGQFASVAGGISAFSGVSNLVGEVAKSVVAIGNLTFEEKEIRNGKLVTVGTRQFNQSDFDKVGTSVGSIISSLTAPLSEIGKQDGFFSDSDVENGIEALTGIGDILNPLVETVRAFNSNDINETTVGSFNATVGSLISGISNIFSSNTGDIDEDQLEMMSDGVDTINNLIDPISDSDFNKNVESFKNLSVSVGTIKDNINGIDLGKLTKFNELMSLIVDSENSEKGFQQLSEAFEKLAEAIISMQTPVPNVSQATTTTNIIERRSDDQTNSDQNEKLTELFENSNQEVVGALGEISEMLASKTFKVRLMENNI